MWDTIYKMELRLGNKTSPGFEYQLSETSVKLRWPYLPAFDWFIGKVYWVTVSTVTGTLWGLSKYEVAFYLDLLLGEIFHTKM